MTIDTLRHYEIFNPRENDAGVTIIGAGAIGSRVFALLVELGLEKITVYDHDYVEGHNLANQLYSADDVGYTKVCALNQWVTVKLGQDPPPSTMRFIAEKVTPETEIDGTVFLLVDSLETRRDLAASFVSNYKIPRVIDARMGAMHGKVICYSPHILTSAYLDTLGSDDDAEVSACGSPYSVAPTAALLASVAVWQFVNAKVSPAAVDEVTNIYCSPFVMSTSKL
jgi:molybdopterin/thiamine biosynthesis adenylyltransferase